MGSRLNVFITGLLNRSAPESFGKITTSTVVFALTITFLFIVALQSSKPLIHIMSSLPWMPGAWPINEGIISILIFVIFSGWIAFSSCDLNVTFFLEKLLSILFYGLPFLFLVSSPSEIIFFICSFIITLQLIKLAFYDSKASILDGLFIFLNYYFIVYFSFVAILSHIYGYINIIEVTPWMSYIINSKEYMLAAFLSYYLIIACKTVDYEPWPAIASFDNVFIDTVTKICGFSIIGLTKIITNFWKTIKQFYVGHRILFNSMKVMAKIGFFIGVSEVFIQIPSQLSVIILKNNEVAVVYAEAKLAFVFFVSGQCVTGISRFYYKKTTKVTYRTGIAGFTILCAIFLSGVIIYFIPKFEGTEFLGFTNFYAPGPFTMAVIAIVILYILFVKGVNFGIPPENTIRMDNKDQNKGKDNKNENDVKTPFGINKTTKPNSAITSDALIKTEYSPFAPEKNQEHSTEREKASISKLMNDTTQNPRFIAQGLTVLDNNMGLIWTREFSSQKYTMKEAINFLDGQNYKKLAEYSDWKLPTIEQLETICDSNRSPKINQSLFMTGRPAIYWSSTIDSTNEKKATYFDYRTGEVKTGFLGKRYYVRLVRQT